MAYIKLTPEIEEKLLNHIRMGMPIVQSCSLAGIAEKTYYNWIDYSKDDSRKDQELFVQFLQKLKKAEAEAQANLVKHIKEDTTWQSKAWILERRWASTWGRQERVTLAGDANNPIEYKQKLSDDAIKSIEQTILDEVRKNEPGNQ